VDLDAEGFFSEVPNALAEGSLPPRGCQSERRNPLLLPLCGSGSGFSEKEDRKGMTITAQRPVRRFQRCYFVYILASLRGTLYTGMTDDLRKRIMQHKDGLFDGFTRKYEVDRLMYFESFSDPKAAAQREQQIKGYRREKKIALFRESNPQWRDLTPEIFQTLLRSPERPRPFPQSRTATAKASLPPGERQSDHSDTSASPALREKVGTSEKKGAR